MDVANVIIVDTIIHPSVQQIVEILLRYGVAILKTLISFHLVFHYHVLTEAFAFNMDIHEGNKNSITPV